MQARQNAIRRRNKIRHWLYGIIIGLFVVLLGVYSVIATSLRPINHANKVYSELVLQKKKLKQVDQFYWSSRKKTYYTLIGKNSKGQTTGVIVSAKTKKMTVINMSDGLSYQQIKQKVVRQYQPQKITNVGMSLYQHVPVWEVKFIDRNGMLNFITIQFSNGKVVRTIRNL
ncbi:DUF5590 domain-containing protein [Weissella diestrammenae]|uniref:DUF5590 domain-containing protein n=1 Tax=Weissella diestrammenae TaxID=1162633 RepID=A0A7G9T4M5_9LACO|nr:DUF5590 domain-containing protein [Weissella diestrammenae]MCM0582081.1 DUF5590 domain-containing protein [Weissella diestrammenae]QNN75050.1 DUF5590 domain-containing protein [Weissella diestrammenae]